MQELLPKNLELNLMVKNSWSKQDFEIFKREFEKWQDKFGLLGYQVYFKHEPCHSDEYATITTSQPAMAATVILNAEITIDEKKRRPIRLIAKHEALHLLTHRLVNLAYCRFLDDSDIVEASEELTRKLEKLL